MYTENKTRVQIWKTKEKSYIIIFMITSTKKESYTVCCFGTLLAET